METANKINYQVYITKAVQGFPQFPEDFWEKDAKDSSPDLVHQVAA